jgi:hypothetical protein
VTPTDTIPEPEHSYISYAIRRREDEALELPITPNRLFRAVARGES